MIGCQLLAGLIGLKRSDTLVPAEFVFVQGREVNGLPYMEIKSSIVRILGYFQPMYSTFLSNNCCLQPPVLTKSPDSLLTGLQM